MVRAVGGRHRHLHRVVDPVPAPGLLDQPDRPRHGRQRVVDQAEREGEVEEDLGVGRALDLPEERRVDGERQVALDRPEAFQVAVVHPEPAAVPERVAVGLLHRGAGGGADVGEDAPRGDVTGQVAQVAVVPRRLDAVEDPWRVPVAVPPHAEAVPVRLLSAEPGVQALHDQRVLRLVEQVLQEHRRAGVGEPSAHRATSLPRWPVVSVDVRRAAARASPRHQRLHQGHPPVFLTGR